MSELDQTLSRVLAVQTQVDQWSAEFRDPETPLWRKAALHYKLRALYDTLTRLARESNFSGVPPDSYQR